MRRRAIWLTVATIATALLTSYVAPKALGPLPHGIKSPVLAAELVENQAEIVQVYGGSQTFRDDLQANTLCDFLFIASYGAMFFVMGQMAGGKTGFLISVGAVVASLGDVVEDIGILRTIHATAITDMLAVLTRVPSLIKWGSLAVVCVATGIFWMSVRGQTLRFVGGVLYVLAGIAIAWGLFRPDNMALAWIPLSMAIVIQLVVLISQGELGEADTKR